MTHEHISSRDTRRQFFSRQKKTYVLVSQEEHYSCDTRRNLCLRHFEEMRIVTRDKMYCVTKDPSCGTRRNLFLRHKKTFLIVSPEENQAVGLRLHYLTNSSAKSGVFVIWLTSNFYPVSFSELRYYVSSGEYNPK